MARTRSAKRKGFPDNLYMDKGGYFSYRNPISGKRKGIGRDKPFAFSEARKANAAIAALTPSSLVDWVAGVKQVSLKEWTATYRKLWIEQTSPAAATLRNQGRYIERIGEAEFAWMPMNKITTAHIAKYLELITEESGAATTVLIRSRISDIFRMAVTKGLIDAGASPVTSTYKPDYDIARERLSLEQFLAIRDKAQPFLSNAMNLALLTGQRREDIAAMKFTDWYDDHLFIVQGKSQGKTRIKMDVNISLKAVNMSILDVLKLCRDNVLSPYLVHHTISVGTVRPGHAVSENGLSNAFQRSREQAGIVAADERTPPSFHEIRSLAERLYREQYGPEFAQAILGHKNAKMTDMYDDMRGAGWQIVAAR